MEAVNSRLDQDVAETIQIRNNDDHISRRQTRSTRFNNLQPEQASLSTLTSTHRVFNDSMRLANQSLATFRNRLDRSEIRNIQVVPDQVLDNDQQNRINILECKKRY